MPGAGEAQMPVETPPKNILGVWVGTSFSTAGGDFVGSESNRKLRMAAIRYGRALVRGTNADLFYIVDLIPLVAATNNPTGPPPQIDLEKCGTIQHFNIPCFAPDVVVETAYGVGIAPLGMRLNLGNRDGMALSLEALGGMLAFNRAVPFGNARRFNFTLQLGAGLDMAITSRWHVSAGYRFYHLSNAGTGEINPGLDANVLLLGFERVF